MPSPDWLRPSNLPRLALCRAAGATSEGCVSASSDATELGKACHELAAIAKRDGIDRVESLIGSLAFSYVVPAEAIRELWEAVKPDPFWQTRSPNVEQPVDLTALGIERKGTVDYYEVDGDTVRVVDFKTGASDYADPSQFWQLDAYAVALALKQKKPRAQSSLWFWRLGTEGWAEAEPFAVATRQKQIEALAQESIDQARRKPEERDYRTGEHCTFCAGRVQCPAYQANMATFLAVTKYEPPTLTPANAPAVYQRASQVEKLAKAAREAVRSLLEVNGNIPIDETYELRLIDVSMPQRVLPATTFKRVQRAKRKKIS